MLLNRTDVEAEATVAEVVLSGSRIRNTSGPGGTPPSGDTKVVRTLMILGQMRRLILDMPDRIQRRDRTCARERSLVYAALAGQPKDILL